MQFESSVMGSGRERHHGRRHRDTLGQRILASATAVMLSVAAETESTEPRRWRDLDDARIRDLAEMLSPGPRGLGVPITDRAAWSAIGTNRGLRGIVREAEQIAASPMPPWNDELYLDFSRTGRRRDGERMIAARRRQLAPLVWAECVEKKGRFLPAIARTLREYVREPTWTLPAHDASLQSFRGETFAIDLAAASVAFELAQALWLLGGQLDPVVHGEVVAALERRVFEPFRITLRTGRGQGWLRSTHNWNAVCLAGTVGAALAVISNRDDRAVFVAAAEQGSRKYLEGFGRDGYCSEGIGYWNYGFSHFALLREVLWQATDGRLDLFNDPRVREIALYGARIEIVDGTYPAIADCPPGTRPSASLLGYCSLALGLGLQRYEDAWRPADRVPRSLTMGAWEMFAASLAATPPAASVSDPLGLRSWFDEGGVLICRSAPGERLRWGFAFKGGHNAEHHNHNDVGSWTLVLDGRVLAGDPGGPHTYTARTFSSQRYSMKLFSSYGHPVPRVGGCDQRSGRAAAARILHVSFADDRDVLSMDLAAAYEVPGLRSLVRTFEHIRSPLPELRITDEWMADVAIEFETAITTRTAWRLEEPALLTLDDGEGRRVVVRFEAPNGGVRIEREKIEEDCEPFERIGIRVVRPTASGRISMRCVPYR